uniref:GGDEF domain-containing response regulator n=1 Tax=Ningiella ruwaisensis TaxID=2364274 RepID=UPI00109F8FBA|nr:response regulator [Ningiella ruwaisensis]
MLNTSRQFASTVEDRAINLPISIQSQYQADLRSLVKAWAQVRKARQSKALASFDKQLNNTSQQYTAFALYSLHQMFQTMQASCKKGVLEKQSIEKTISDIDWLMNQLIRSSKLEPDPFLCESDSLENFLPKLKQANSRFNVHRTSKIALIDDERSVGKALTAILKQFSLDVCYYPSITSFEQSLEHDTPDLVLLDIIMPKVSTPEVFQFANQLVKRDIKVIACSGLFSFETRLHAVRAGVSDYVVKPINPYLLVEKISRALNRNVITKHQIVMLDDQDSMGQFYEAVFSQVSVDFHYFTSAEKLIAALDHLQPDLFLLDRVMPSVNGLEVAAMIRQEAKFDFSPIVFLTANEQIDTKLNVLAHGADDLIAKSTPAPMVLEQVLARLERAAFIKSFVSTDPLTGVLNHGQIVEAANHQMRLDKREKSDSVLAIVDVDHFKNVNDTHGHAAGDTVLNGLGQLLKSCMRETDYVGRYGGEEFVLVFVNCELEEAFKKLDSIRKQCQNMQFIASKPEVSISFSAGLVSLQNFEALPTAINEADRFLYNAKENGRNQIKSPLDK